MYAPTPTAKSFSEYLLTVSGGQFTDAGQEVIELVESAAIASSLISDADYFYYNQYTTWRWSTYVQHHALTI